MSDLQYQEDTTQDKKIQNTFKGKPILRLKSVKLIHHHCKTFMPIINKKVPHHCSN